MEKVRWTDHEEIKEYFTEFRRKENTAHSKTKEGYMDGSYIAQKLHSAACYSGKDRSDGKNRKKQTATGWP